jgi:hypothetical protein
MLGRDTWSGRAEPLSVFPSKLLVIDLLGGHFEAYPRLGSGERLAQSPDDRSEESGTRRVFCWPLHRKGFRGNGSLEIFLS